jgi:hypothetical protein
MTARRNARELVLCATGVRVVTGLEGKVIKVVSIAPAPQSIVLGVARDRHELTVSPSRVISVPPSVATYPRSPHGVSHVGQRHSRGSGFHIRVICGYDYPIPGGHSGSYSFLIVILCVTGAAIVRCFFSANS